MGGDGAQLAQNAPGASPPREHPEVALALQDIAVRTQETAQTRALLACISCGLAELPIMQTDFVAHSPQALWQEIQTRDLRDALVPMLLDSTLGAWLVVQTAAKPKELDKIRVRAKSARVHLQRALVDECLRVALRRRECSVAPGVTVESYEQLREFACQPRGRALLADPAVRERIRLALGDQNGTMLPGTVTTPGGVSETGLAALLEDKAVHLFSWSWLRLPVLWFGADVNVVGIEALCARLDDPQWYDAARGAFSTRLGFDWCSAQGRPVPDAIAHPKLFPAIALWLGDRAANVHAKIAPQSLTVAEGGTARLGLSGQRCYIFPPFASSATQVPSHSSLACHASRDSASPATCCESNVHPTSFAPMTSTSS